MGYKNVASLCFGGKSLSIREAKLIPFAHKCLWASCALLLLTGFQEEDEGEEEEEQDRGAVVPEIHITEA